MRRVWPLVLIMLVGCRSVYRGSDLDKVVLTEHSALIVQQMTFFKNGQAAEAIGALGERARDHAKFEEFRDKAQAMLEASLKVGGQVKSYQIVEAEKITDDAPRASGAANGKPSQGIIVRVKVEFEHGTGEFEYTFFLIDGIWKSARFGIGFRAAAAV